MFIVTSPLPYTLIRQTNIKMKYSKIKVAHVLFKPYKISLFMKHEMNWGNDFKERPHFKQNERMWIPVHIHKINSWIKGEAMCWLKRIVFRVFYNRDKKSFMLNFNLEWIVFWYLKTLHSPWIQKIDFLCFHKSSSKKMSTSPKSKHDIFKSIVWCVCCKFVLTWYLQYKKHDFVVLSFKFEVLTSRNKKGI